MIVVGSDMATKKDFIEFVMGQMVDASAFTVRPMMGEYLVYYQGVLIGGFYDNRFLLKMNADNANYALPTAIPYANAKPMYMVDNFDDRERLATIIKATYIGCLKTQKTPKRK